MAASRGSAPISPIRSAPPSPERPRREAFWGRRKAHRLRPRQAELIAALLPRLKIPGGPIASLADLFPRPVDDVVLEIGFGGGEHLVAAAMRHPRVGFIGVEPFVNGVAKLIAALEELSLDTVRIDDGDAAALLARLPAASLGRVFLLYPDPWPKRRQRKRRFVSAETLAELARVMKQGAELRFATDIDDYAAWTLRHLLNAPEFRWMAERAEDWRQPWPDWLGTRYEVKALAAGRRPVYLTAVRT